MIYSLGCTSILFERMNNCTLIDDLKLTIRLLASWYRSEFILWWSVPLRIGLLVYVLRINLRSGCLPGSQLSSELEVRSKKECVSFPLSPSLFLCQTLSLSLSLLCSISLYFFLPPRLLECVCTVQLVSSSTGVGGCCVCQVFPRSQSQVHIFSFVN